MLATWRLRGCALGVVGLQWGQITAMSGARRAPQRVGGARADWWVQAADCAAQRENPGTLRHGSSRAVPQFPAPSPMPQLGGREGPSCAIGAPGVQGGKGLPQPGQDRHTLHSLWSPPSAALLQAVARGITALIAKRGRACPRGEPSPAQGGAR